MFIAVTMFASMRLLKKKRYIIKNNKHIGMVYNFMSL